MRLLKLSAEMGNPYSCYAFAALFDNGAAGITAEEAEAMCCIAAEAGVEEAEERLKRGFGNQRQIEKGLNDGFFQPRVLRPAVQKPSEKRGRSRKEI